MASTVGLTEFQTSFPDRFHDLGIAEQACVAMAAGLASQGMRPFFPVVTTFMTRAIDQLIYDVALHGLPVVLLLDRAGVTGPDGPSHHGLFDVGLLRTVPQIEIYAPWTAQDVSDVLGDCLTRDHGLVVLRYPKDHPAEVDHAYIGAGGLVRYGAGICLVAHGATVTLVLQAAEILERRYGIDCDVWRVARLHPLDPTLVKHAASARLVVTVEETGKASSMAPALQYEIIQQHGNAVPVERLSLPDGFLPHGGRSELLAEFGFTADAVAEFVRAKAGGPAADGTSPPEEELR
jgi:1-deoxy-D-xylulose-5-phosphate synthase